MNHALDWSDLWKLLGMLVLVLMNGFFVAAELALVKVRETQLDTLIAKGHRRARIARRIINNIDGYIGATQLGITLASLGLGIVVEPVFHALLDPVFAWLKVESDEVQRMVSILVGFFINTFLLIVVGELAPKALAIRKTLSTALWTAQPLEWFYRIAFPFIWLLNQSAQWLLRRFGVEAATEAELAHTAEELRLLIASSQKHATGTKLGREVLLNALELQRRVVREVMRPRQEIVRFDTASDLTACLDLAERTRFSRFPLCAGGDVDKTLGVVHIKDLYAARAKARSGADLAEFARKLIYVPETARLEKVLHLFLERKLHFAIVVDEFGGTVGMLTLENILEELVGQIQDEFDQEQPLLVPAGEGVWDVAGTLPLHELAELVGEPLAEEGVSTVSGWVTRRLGGFPKTGERIVVGRHELRVEAMDGPKVARLKLRKLADGEVI